MTQGRRFDGKHCRPCPLNPRGWAGVIDIDAGMDGCPLTSTQLPPDVVVAQAGRQNLTSAHHAELVA